MKKILPMILLLSFSLPALAAEVILKCSLADGRSEIWGFDEANGTVTAFAKKTSVNEECGKSISYCNKYFITPEEFGMRRFLSGVDSGNILKISRMDGEYSWQHGTEIEKGKCAPFKQAF